jgi:hypothetical protein
MSKICNKQWGNQKYIKNLSGKTSKDGARQLGDLGEDGGTIIK